MENETIETITQKYTQTCAAIGDAQFKLKAIETFIKQRFDDLSTLDKQAFEIKKAEEAAKTNV